ncbi:type II toxin-antitoxin system RelE family toxin [Devosia sp.]|uniref:type II toxin-antitoxin system RelE family toxin n=1 Tax=Devosia sp. TaxID=1871048 RepID=UPI003BAC52B0
MAWTVELDQAAVKQLKKLGKAEASRIRNFLRDRLAVIDDPRSVGKPLQGSKFGELWRYRVGGYRVVCQIIDQRLVVLVVGIGHRSEIYR